MYSMTGYGKGVAEFKNLTVTIELKSVNHRFLDIMLKLPKNLLSLEDVIRKNLSANFSRGHIDVYINIDDRRENMIELSYDENIVKQYIKVADSLNQVGVKNDLSLSSLLKIPQLIYEKNKKEEDDILLSEMTAKAVKMASDNLSLMRKTEGELIIIDINNRLLNIENYRKEVLLRAPLVATDHRIKLTERINEALADIVIDQSKLLNEVAFFIDKSNIDEELTRLDAHLKHYNEILLSDGAVGKKLDFLTQELNREVNTIGSKSNDLILTQLVLNLKNEVEKIREQIQNIE